VDNEAMLIWNTSPLDDKEKYYTDKWHYRLVVEKITESLFSWRVKAGISFFARSGYAKTLEAAKKFAEYHAADQYWYNEVHMPHWDLGQAYNGFIYAIWTDFGYKFALREQNKWWIGDNWMIEYNLKVYNFVMLPVNEK
jgi:hypothetical protein